MRGGRAAVNGAAIDRRRPAQTALTQHLPHPPFVFDLPRFTPGTLEAIGYLGGLPKASHLVATPGAVSRVELVVDDLASAAADTEADVLFAHAQLRDAHGSLCIDESPAVTFAIEAGAELLGPPMVEAEAGIASVVVRLPHGSSGFRLHAKAPSFGNVPAATLLWRRGTGAAVDAPRNDPSRVP